MAAVLVKRSIDAKTRFSFLKRQQKRDMAPLKQNVHK